MTYQVSPMHMAAMLDFECLNCCWVNAHILDETIAVENMGMGIQIKSLSRKIEKFWRICDLPHHIYGGHVGFRFSVVDVNISLSYLRSLLMTMWE